MVVTADVLRNAKLRLVQHYLVEMQASELRYQQTPQDKSIVLQQFGEELPQIQQMFEWMTTQIVQDEVLSDITSDYLVASPNLLRALMLHEDILAWHWQGFHLAERQHNLTRQLLHLEQIGQIEQMMTLFQEAYQHLQQALALARRLHDREAIASCLYGLARVAYGSTLPTRAQRLVKQSLHFANPTTQKPLLLDLYLLWNGIARNLGQAADVFASLEKAIELAEEFDDAEKIARCKRIYSSSLGLSSTRFTEMIAYGEAALAMMLPYRNTLEILNCYRVLGIGHWHCGNYETAIPYLQEAFRLGKELPPLHQSNLFHYQDMADTLTALQRFDEARAYLEEVYRLNRQAQDPICDIFYHAQLGSILLWQGDLAGGLQQLERWLQLCEQLNTEISFPPYIKRRGDAELLLRNDAHAALSFYQAGLRSARVRGNYYETCDILCQITLAYLMLGQAETAQPYFAEAATLAHAMQTPTFVHRVAVARAFYTAYDGDLVHAQQMIAEITLMPSALHPEVQDALTLFRRCFPQ